MKRFFMDTFHHNDLMISAMASKITSLTIVYSTVYSGTEQRKHQRCTSLAFGRGIHKGPVTQTMFPFDDVITCQFIIISPCATLIYCQEKWTAGSLCHELWSYEASKTCKHHSTLCIVSTASRHGSAHIITWLCGFWREMASFFSIAADLIGLHMPGVKWSYSAWQSPTAFIGNGKATLQPSIMFAD